MGPGSTIETALLHWWEKHVPDNPIRRDKGNPNHPRPAHQYGHVRELTAVCDRLEDTSACKVVVLQGQDGRFCDGIDFAEFRPDQPMTFMASTRGEDQHPIERLPKAIIARPAKGGGAQLAWLRMLSWPIRATIQFDEVHQGFAGDGHLSAGKGRWLGHAKESLCSTPLTGR